MPGDFQAQDQYRVAEKTELFARYDYSKSVIAPGEIQRWNLFWMATFWC